MMDFEKLKTKQKRFPVLVGEAVKSSASDAPRLDLLYLKFKEDRPEEEALAEIVSHQVVNYALPKSKIAKLLSQMSTGDLDVSCFSELEAEARRAFIMYNQGGVASKDNIRFAEVGEVIAFCIASHYLNAGQVAAKMALKTNSEMPVFGLDGIHVKKEEDGTVTVFFLESKMVSAANSGAQQYAKSAKGFSEDRGHKLNEKRISRDLSNLDLLSGTDRDSALKYFDPYSAEHASVRERFVGVIIYTENAYRDKVKAMDAIPVDLHEKEFLNKLSIALPDILKSFKHNLALKGCEDGKCRAFYFAVPDVDNLKKLFAKEMSNGYIC